MPASPARGRSNSTHSVGRCWRSTGRQSGGGTIFARFRLHLTMIGASMSSAEVSPAKTSATPASGLALLVSSPASGPSSPDAFGYFDPASSSWRTLGPLLFGASDESLATFPRSGSMRSGQLYPHVPWVPHTHERDCSLWPTPRANGGNNAGGSNGRKSAIRNGTYVSGRVNPNLYEWLMGFPTDWTGTAV